MHHTCSVRGFKAQTNLTKNSCCLGRRQFPFLLNQALQIHTLDEVHRDELRRAVLTDIENPDDVFVDDRLCKEHFLLESFKCGRSSSHLGRIVLRATRRVSWRSKALYTAPMPPRPMRSTIW